MVWVKYLKYKIARNQEELQRYSNIYLFGAIWAATVVQIASETEGKEASEILESLNQPGFPFGPFDEDILKFLRSQAEKNEI
ncbi:MAG: hypothetical protein RMJ34_07330 [candidate division WOR-3 bacterium]|nr:hypothetical protein [candidate division WOR-3 bacterium]MDW8114723.1 hypothetical protein [candidate division WOR-3 bacterium]